MQSTLRLITLVGVILLAPLAAQEKALPVLQYVDGHGNSYEFLDDGGGYTLEFEPVKKASTRAANPPRGA